MGMVLALLNLDTMCWHRPDFLVKTDQNVSVVSDMGKKKNQKVEYMFDVYLFAAVVVWFCFLVSCSKCKSFSVFS